MSESDRIIGNLQKGMEALEYTVEEIRADVKTLLSNHHRTRGITYAVSAFVGGLTGLFTGLLKL